METLTLFTSGFLLIGVVWVIIGFAIGAFFALPMIWYHAGFISRKLSRINELLETAQGQK